MFKKLLLSFFVFLTLTLSFVPLAHAQTQSGKWYSQSFQEWFTKVNDSPENEIFGERYTAAQVQWVIYGLAYFIIQATGNPDAVTCLFTKDTSECADILDTLFESLKAPTSSIPNQNFVSVMLEDRPLSGIHYLKDLGRKFNIIPRVSAQSPGIGFSSLDPVLPLWRAVRNVSYSLFILAIVILSFMIMFRIKISPQVVISVQSALPKIAISLILVTFSYAIAGFVVDLMYLVIGFISLVVSQAVSSVAVVGVPVGSAASPLAIFNILTKGLLGLGIFGWIIVYFGLFSLALVATLMGSGGIVSLIVKVITLVPVAGIMIVAMLAMIVIFVVLLLATFKIIWMLLKTFASILLLVIFAPIQIAAGIVVPSAGFGAWLKSLAANLAVFPVTGLLFLLSYVFAVQAWSWVFVNFIRLPFTLTDFIGSLSFIPVPAGSSWPPLLGVSEMIIPFLWLGVSLAIMLMIPKVTEMIQSFISGKPFGYGAAIGESFGAPTSLGKAGIGYYAGKVDRRGTEAAEAAGRQYVPPAWITSLRSVGVLPKR